MSASIDTLTFDAVDPLRPATFWTVMADPEGNGFCVLRGPGDGWVSS
ncbi:MAG: hypothetical protein ACHQY1_07635 [Myxococcota bacterium]